MRYPFISDYDIYLFREGKHTKLYKKFGSHFVEFDGKKGVFFALWAPNAKSVSIRGDFNNYSTSTHKMHLRDDDSGVWELFVENLSEFITYKYHIVSKYHNIVHDKSDPFGFFAENPPKSASKLYNIDGYKWNDKKWITNRKKYNAHNAPINIYEMHLGSWRRKVEEDNRFLTYKELADELVEYLLELNYTHVEFMPLTEYPYDGSWGYQVVGYFSATSRYGTPKDLMYLIDKLHQNCIGVIIDWVPSHFAVDMHGLINFDGTALYEHEDPRQGYHPQWGSLIFNYARNEVKSFLISSAMFWLEYYHIDGIRVDAVASMLYLNFGREDSSYVPNKYGGNENLEAIEFLKELNVALYGEFNDIVMIAEESSAYPKLTRLVSDGGVGFGFKWNMGWMHDTLKYLSIDPIARMHHHHQLTFSMWYGFDENFLLPLSHDEVVHGKSSLIYKMPGSDKEKFANLRAMYGYMLAHPGKKLLFMGGEFAQTKEWNFASSLDWHLLQFKPHSSLQELVKRVNFLYKNEEALHFYDEKREGFEWIDDQDYTKNIISFVRKSETQKVYVICNFSGEPRRDFPLGVDEDGEYEVIFNTDDAIFGGDALFKYKQLTTSKDGIYNRRYKIILDVAPLSSIYIKYKI